MITKDAKFGNTENVMVCEMGTGDVWMLGSELGEKGETILAMKTVDEPQPINIVGKASVGTFDEMKHQATIMGGHTAMTWLKDKGSYDLTFVRGLAN